MLIALVEYFVSDQGSFLIKQFLHKELNGFVVLFLRCRGRWLVGQVSLSWEVLNLLQLLNVKNWNFMRVGIECLLDILSGFMGQDFFLLG